MNFTVLGAGGFIGSHLVTRLRGDGHACAAIGRGDALPAEGLGHAIYCVGLTADFRDKPFETVRAHTSLVAEVLERGDFESFLYLSSTRLYLRGGATREEAPIAVLPAEADDLYNATKLAGEALCLSCGHPGARVARLSNVYGADFASENFLSALVRAAVDDGRIVLRSAPDGEKDYVSVDSVAGVLPRIAAAGRERIYNVASGRNVSSRSIVERLAGLTGCAVETGSELAAVKFPVVDVGRARAEFGFESPALLDDLPGLVKRYGGRPRAEDRR